MGPRSDERDLRVALDTSVHEGLPLAAAVIAALEAVFVGADLLFTPAPFALRVALADALLVVLFIAGYVALRRGMVKPRHAHALAATLALAVSADTLHDTYLLGDPQQTVYLMLVAVGVGAIFLSTPWMLGVAVANFAGWVGIALLRPDVEWTTFGLGLLAASVLGVVIHLVRLRTLRRLHALHLAEAEQRERLLEREHALQQAVLALGESEERYRDLVEGSPDATLVLADDRVLYANEAALHLFGAPDADALLGRDWRELVVDDHSDAARDEDAPREIVGVRLDGATVDVELRQRAITYLARDARQAVLRDVTDRKRAEADRRLGEERVAEIARLKELDRVKTEFVNTISHELRTPLTPIRVQLHLLKAAKDIEGVRKAADVLDRNVLRLSSLLDELLEVARIQAGTLRLVRTRVDLGDTIRHAAESFDDVARAQGVALTAEIEPDLAVDADAKRIHQVVYNLLGNAFKFTPQGGKVRLTVRRDGARALVAVDDTGVGLSAADIARLFTPFSQAEETRDRTDAGTGLGLFICRGIVEGHGGSIWAESDGRGKGARFAFHLPLPPKPS